MTEKKKKLFIYTCIEIYLLFQNPQTNSSRYRTGHGSSINDGVINSSRIDDNQPNTYATCKSDNDYGVSGPSEEIVGDIGPSSHVSRNDNDDTIFRLRDTDSKSVDNSNVSATRNVSRKTGAFAPLYKITGENGGDKIQISSIGATADGERKTSTNIISEDSNNGSAEALTRHLRQYSDSIVDSARSLAELCNEVNPSRGLYSGSNDGEARDAVARLEPRGPFLSYHRSGAPNRSASFSQVDFSQGNLVKKKKNGYR